MANIDNKPTKSVFKFEKLNIDDFRNILKNMKNDGGVKNLNKRVLQEICDDDEICKYILEIFNTSMENGIFPNCLKTLTIIPISKIQNTKKCDEFRPINILPNI